jgi:hypothetical protein
VPLAQPVTFACAVVYEGSWTIPAVTLPAILTLPGTLLNSLFNVILLLVFDCTKYNKSVSNAVFAAGNSEILNFAIFYYLVYVPGEL